MELTERLSVKTSRRQEMIDITPRVNEALRKAGARDGICVIFVTHTTAGVTINENADPAVGADIEAGLDRIAPEGAGYRHAEGNSPAHIKSTVVGPSITVPVAGGRLTLGTWQSVFLCEFDGPRTRTAVVSFIKG
ncbi:MAG: secondary thiamine-phosphate synthase enzyme YjbQ [bacterium]